MAGTATDCALCRAAAGDAELSRVEAWHDEHRRLAVSLDAEILCFAYLEPRRHIPHITDLDGAEAAAFGPVLARVAARLTAGG